MGVDFSIVRRERKHGCSYSGFAAFRRKVCESIGADYDAMVVAAAVPGWTDHPLYPLLNHSDCDGELHWEEADAIARALREVVEAWDVADVDGWRAWGLKFVEMCEEAAEVEGRIEFH